MGNSLCSFINDSIICIYIRLHRKSNREKQHRKGHGRKFIFTILKKCKNTSIFSYLWQKNLILHNFPDEKNNAYRIYIYIYMHVDQHLHTWSENKLNKTPLLSLLGDSRLRSCLLLSPNMLAHYQHADQAFAYPTYW